jgi:hypothetical protein
MPDGVGQISGTANSLDSVEQIFSTGQADVFASSGLFDC